MTCSDLIICVILVKTTHIDKEGNKTGKLRVKHHGSCGEGIQVSFALDYLLEAVPYGSAEVFVWLASGWISH